MFGKSFIFPVSSRKIHVWLTEREKNDLSDSVSEEINLLFHFRQTMSIGWLWLT
jgi:hypothetical protein